MIKPSKLLSDYIKAITSMDEACKRLDVSEATLYSYLNETVSVSSKFIYNVKKVTGLDFEKAFVTTNEGRVGNEDKRDGETKRGRVR